MKLAVVGSRTFKNKSFIEACLSATPGITEIVSGGAIGPDSFAEAWAKKKGITTVIFKPDWNLGNGAGIIRNRQIVGYADEVMAFWDGLSRGTQYTVDFARKMKKRVMLFIETDPKTDTTTFENVQEE